MTNEHKTWPPEELVESVVEGWKRNQAAWDSAVAAAYEEQFGRPHPSRQKESDRKEQRDS